MEAGRRSKVKQLGKSHPPLVQYMKQSSQRITLSLEGKAVASLSPRGYKAMKKIIMSNLKSKEMRTIVAQLNAMRTY